VPRGGPASLEDLARAADALDRGQQVHPQLEQALLHGSSIGGARPKAVLVDGRRALIAKFSSTSDPYPVVKAEAAVMALAQRCGLSVSATELVSCLGRDVLLVERFDRGPGPGERRMMVSALTILGLSEVEARYATYPDLADQIRARFRHPAAALRELFGRIVFNVCVSNTDDHARNHAAFWDGQALELTPAYDLCPQLRSGGEAAQAMAIGRDGSRRSKLAVCIDAAETYLLARPEAEEIVGRTVAVIEESWDDVAQGARLTRDESRALWRRQILNPFAQEPA